MLQHFTISIIYINVYFNPFYDKDFELNRYRKFSKSIQKGKSTLDVKSILQSMVIKLSKI